jgi:carbonic anhydrase
MTIKRHHAGRQLTARSPQPRRRALLGFAALSVRLAWLHTSSLNVGLRLARAAPTAAGETDALLLNCMDFRLVNEVTAYMNERRMTNQYDQVILAGASLGPATDKFPAWAETFWQHLDIAIELHHIRRVIALDHRDCGAYRVAYGQDFAADPAAETAVHTQLLTTFRDMVKQRHPELEVELLLMDLNGQIEPIG